MNDLGSLNILTVIERYAKLDIKQGHRNRNEIHCPCPRCGGEDRFEITIDKNVFRCRDHCESNGGCGNAISFVQWWKDVGYEAACVELKLKQYANPNGKRHVSKSDLGRVPDGKPMSVTIAHEPTPPTKQVDNSKPQTLAEYGNSHGVPDWHLLKRGWKNTTYQNRPAIEIPSSDGNPRIRLMDKKEYRRKEKDKGSICWYAFPGTVDQETIQEYIILANGQISVEAARFVGVQAFSVTDGEKALPKPLLTELKALLKKNDHTTCIIALDADEAGRNARDQIIEQLEGYKILSIDFGGNAGFDIADFAVKHTSQLLPELLKITKRPPSTITNSDDIAMNIISELEAPNIIIPGASGTYLPVPWKSLHRFGGFAHVLHPGKIGMILAPSGHGKTSMLETWLHWWLVQGFDMIWYGPEWTETEYVIRHIQMLKGMTLTDYALHNIWKAETAKGDEPIYGKQLTENLRTKSISILKGIRKYPGKVYYLPPAKNVETSQEQATALLHLLRRQGRQVGGVIWDYLQLLSSIDGEQAGNKYETTLGSLKHFAESTQTVNIVGSQVNKDITKQLGQGEYKISAADAHYVREDKTNLLLGIEPIYQQEKTPHGKTEWAFQNRARLRILKNSIGDRVVGGSGYTMIKANFRYLSWEEMPTRY